MRSVDHNWRGVGGAGIEGILECFLEEITLELNLKGV